MSEGTDAEIVRERVGWEMTCIGDHEALAPLECWYHETLAAVNRVLNVVEAAKPLRRGISLGQWQQVYLVGDHFYFTVEAFDEALSALSNGKENG